MKKEEITNLYEELVQDRDAYEDNLKKYPVAPVLELLDDLSGFAQPLVVVLQMTQDDYSRQLSDNKLSFDFSGRKVEEIMDRLIISHTDGVVKDQTLKLEYLHEDPYESGQYNVKTDLNIVQYGLAVIAAVANITDLQTLKGLLSPDAVVSLRLAVNAIKETGRG